GAGRVVYAGGDVWRAGGALGVRCGAGVDGGGAGGGCRAVAKAWCGAVGGKGRHPGEAGRSFHSGCGLLSETTFRRRRTISSASRSSRSPKKLAASCSFSFAIWVTVLRPFSVI